MDIHPSLAGVGCLGWVQGRCQAPSNWAVQCWVWEDHQNEACAC